MTPTRRGFFGTLFAGAVTAVVATLPQGAQNYLTPKFPNNWLVEKYLTQRALDALRPCFVFKRITEASEIPTGIGEKLTWVRHTK